MQESEFKAAFLTAIRSGGSERERAYRFFEEKCRDQFKGEEGVKFYLDLIELIEEADKSAVPVAQIRFRPLVDPQLLAKKVLGLDGYLQRLTSDPASRQALITFLGTLEHSDEQDLGRVIQRTVASSTPAEIEHILAFFIQKWKQRNI